MLFVYIIIQTGIGRVSSSTGNALYHVAQRARRLAVSHGRVDRLAVLHRNGESGGDTGRRGGGHPRQGRRVRRQLLEGLGGWPERGQRAGPDLL